MDTVYEGDEVETTFLIGESQNLDAKFLISMTYLMLLGCLETFVFLPPFKNGRVNQS